MIVNPVMGGKSGAVDTIDWYVSSGVPMKSEPMIRYKAKEIEPTDFPVAYDGGEVKFIQKFVGFKIEGNVLKLGF